MLIDDFEPNIRTVFDDRTMTTTGENKGRYHVKLGYTFIGYNGSKKQWIPKVFKTNVFATREEFDMIVGKSKRDDIVSKRNKLNERVGTLRQLIKKNPEITYEQCVRLYEYKGSFDNVIGLFDWYYDFQRDPAQEQDGNAKVIRGARNSFKRYKNTEYISFAEVTPRWIEGYEKWARGIGNRRTTIGIYTRALRTIFNVAIDMKLIRPETYPFGDKKYVPPKGKRSTDKSLQVVIKNQVLTFRSDNDSINEALDYWILCFFCNGCNPADIAYLKSANLDDNYLSFERKKTERTEKENETIVIYINELVKGIIARRRTTSLRPNEYIFPILTNDMTSAQRKEAIIQFRRRINKQLVAASDEMKLASSLKLENARYTVANILNDNGMDMDIIGKLMGHNSDITKTYMDSIKNETRKKVSEILSAAS
jgi:integrase/recombinase XerD